jgi:hypothetical protein
VNDKIQETQAKLRELAVQHVTLDMRMKGIRNLYEASALNSNAALMEQFRRELHDLLDLQLDVVNSQMVHTHQLIRLQQP